MEHGLKNRHSVLAWGLGAALVIGILVLPVAVWGSHQFADVPNGQPFHDQIGAIKDAGITTGSTECGSPPPGQTFYCPESLVRRDAMAAFMHRGFGRAGFEEGSSSGLPLGVDVILATVTIEPGAVGGGTGFVVLNASGSVSGDMAPPNNRCPCTLELRIDEVGGTAGTPFLDNLVGINEVPSTGQASSHMSSTRAVQVAAGEAATFNLVVRLNAHAGSEAPENLEAVGALTAIYVPFSADGDNTLDP